MKRWARLIAFLLVWLPAAVHAHSSLEEASPKEGETVKETVKNFQLTFDTKVESGSSFIVKGKDGQVIEPQDLQVTGDTVSGALPEKLEPGPYQVEWKVIGADGHPVSGSYSFEVKTDTDSTSTEAEEEKPDESPRTSKENSGNTGTDQPAPLLIGLIAVLGVAAVAMLILLMRKKR